MGNKGTEGQHLIKRSARHLANQVTNPAYQAAPGKAEPHQGQHLALGMSGDDQHAKQPIDLAGPPPGEPMRTQTGTANLAVSHLGTWRRHDAVATQMRAPAKLDPVPEDRECRGETPELPQTCCCTHIAQ